MPTKCNTEHDTQPTCNIPSNETCNQQNATRHAADRQHGKQFQIAASPNSDPPPAGDTQPQPTKQKQRQQQQQHEQPEMHQTSTITPSDINTPHNQARATQTSTSAITTTTTTTTKIKQLRPIAKRTKDGHHREPNDSSGAEDFTPTPYEDDTTMRNQKVI
jgi:hypothetical protein